MMVDEVWGVYPGPLREGKAEWPWRPLDWDVGWCGEMLETGCCYGIGWVLAITRGRNGG
jgi:hypothetical protein